MLTCSAVADYIEKVRSGAIPVCREQLALCDYVEGCFEAESIYIDEEQLERHLNFQRFFPFELLPWELFVFALHNCTYKSPGVLRWPVLFIYVGRGAGKNGYLAFESFCWLTPVNGVMKYNVDIFATSEDQAMTSFLDVLDVLEEHEGELGQYFTWNREKIENKKTKSQLRFRTASAKTKDGGRPGAVVFDELHAYENYKLIDVAKTGLGKKAMPRQTIITTDGEVRGGPLDDMKERAHAILFEGAPDNGMLPFLCRLDQREEVKDPAMWYKANPSLEYFDTLLEEMKMEYADFQLNPLGNSSFLTKRMNLPRTFEEQSVTDWENIKAANRPLPDLAGCDCVAAIDYAKTTDFVAAGLLFLYDGCYYWMTHSWVCRASADLSRIQAPLAEWEEAGLLTFVDGPEVSVDLPADWIAEQARTYNVTVIGLDNFRFHWLARSLRDHGFDVDKGGLNNIFLTKRVTVMRYLDTIVSIFNNRRIAWGDNPLMNWYVNNACIVPSQGNCYFGKKEERSRKTDGFMALVHAICSADSLIDCGVAGEEFEVFC